MSQSFLFGLRILAIDPASRGLGYVVVEGPDALVEWGFRNSRDNKDSRRVRFVQDLLDHYQPDVLVLEEFNVRQRSPRIKNLAKEFARLAEAHETQVCRVSRTEVRTLFSSSNKYEIAEKLTIRFPELKSFCPPRRKIWKSENPRINLFDALALACTYFAVATEFMKRPSAP